MPRYRNEQPDSPVTDAYAPGFTGVDTTTKATLLPDTVAQYALNLYMDEQGLAVRRPAVRTVCYADYATNVVFPVRAAHWYDTPAYEALVTLRGGSILAAHPDTGAVDLVAATGYTDSPTYRPTMAQLVEHLYRPHETAGLAWCRHTAGAWTTGAVTQFKAGTAMPKFSCVCAHKFRLFAAKEGTDEIYASAYLDASVKDNWDILYSSRVGTGEGDPIVGMISYQENLLLILKEASLWLADTTEQDPANWSIRKLTGLTGCLNGRTAVQLAQDVLFMSRHGVVSVGALAQQNSVSPTTTVSAPMRSSMGAGKACWATRWREFYMLAWDSQNEGVVADKFFVYNTQTGAWVGEWQAPLPAAQLPGNRTAAHLGWAAGVTVRPRGIEDTVLCDGAGRVALLAPHDGQDSTDPFGAVRQDILQQLVSKGWTFGEPANLKSAHRLEVGFFRQSVERFNVELVLDADKTPVAAVEGASDLNGATFPLRFGTSGFSFYGRDNTTSTTHLRPLVKRRFREAAVRVSAGGSGALAIRSILLSVLPGPAPMR